jgi:tetratricopeptide (TPR) repeat protein
VSLWCGRASPPWKGSVRKVMTSMKLGAFVTTASLMAASLLGAGCSLNRQEAAKLAIKGDQELKLNVDGAVNDFEQATKLDPTNHKIFFKLAMAYRKKEDWDKMASALSRATQLAPKFANYWKERGYALEQQARKKTVPWEEVKDPYQKCIVNDANMAECYEELGTAFLWTDDEQKALENYTKAIEHDPNNIGYYTMVAGLYLDLGYVKEAEQVLKEAKGFIKPDDKATQKDVYNVHKLLAKVYQERGSQGEQVTELEAAKAVAPADGPESVVILWDLGSTYAVMTPPKSAEAIAMLKGFTNRACKGSKASTYKSECEQASALMSKLGSN